MTTWWASGWRTRGRPARSRLPRADRERGCRHHWLVWVPSPAFQEVNMRTMYDSVNASAIPRSAEMVAGYVDGIYAWSPQDWARFPDAVKVRISAVGATHLAQVFDVEQGCIWPPERVVPLVVAARRAGIDPTVYVNERNDWGPTKAAFDRAGVAHPHWWLANYDGRADYVTPGAVARQYAHPHDGDGVADRPWETGGHYDLSAVRDYWPGVDEEDRKSTRLNS